MIMLLASRNRRGKALKELAHLHCLDRRHTVRVPPHAQTCSGVQSELMERGAPDFCWVISENLSIDGRKMGLLEALAAVIGQGAGTLLACVPGRLAYYEGEEPGERYILERT